VGRALKGLDIGFPVAMDNEMKIWKAYRNQFWGQVHIIDEKGQIRHYHAGENVEEEVEDDVFFLLREMGTASDIRPRLGEVEAEGNWYVAEDYIEHTSAAKDSVKIRYEGTSFAIGVKTPEKTEVEVKMDGKPLPKDSRDKDVVAKGSRTVAEVEGAKHLHVIKEDLERVHEVEFFVKEKGFQITGFYS
ncbi:MAG TPA: hypothetical protein VMS79_00370, partial [Methanomassiliicoccales archaeon]|nr:hypothetical protein [Methanomassiliicoccales archaeon]